MKKKLPIAFLIIGILLVIVGIALGFYNEFSQAKNEKKVLEEKIVSEYDIFKDKVEVFTETRTTYYSSVVEDLFPETVEENYEDWLLVLNDYTNTIDDVFNSIDYLVDKCIDTNHVNQDVVNKCESFVIAYETVMNYYTKDINAFNEVIRSYLQNGDDEEIVEYTLKYDYTDINSDGKFIGKD